MSPGPVYFAVLWKRFNDGGVVHGVMPRDLIPCLRATFGNKCGGMSSQT